MLEIHQQFIFHSHSHIGMRERFPPTKFDPGVSCDHPPRRRDAGAGEQAVAAVVTDLVGVRHVSVSEKLNTVL